VNCEKENAKENPNSKKGSGASLPEKKAPVNIQRKKVPQKIQKNCRKRGGDTVNRGSSAIPGRAEGTKEGGTIRGGKEKIKEKKKKRQIMNAGVRSVIVGRGGGQSIGNAASRLRKKAGKGIVKKRGSKDRKRAETLTKKKRGRRKWGYCTSSQRPSGSPERNCQKGGGNAK